MALLCPLSSLPHLLAPNILLLRTPLLNLTRVLLILAHLADTRLQITTRLLPTRTWHNTLGLDLLRCNILVAHGTARTNTLQSTALLAAVVQLRAALALAGVAETGVYVCGGGACDGVLRGCRSGGIHGGVVGVGVGREGVCGRGGAGGEGLGVELGGVVGFGDELADLVLRRVSGSSCCGGGKIHTPCVV